MAIKLVAIDIDGTLLNEKREVTKEVKEAIAAAVAKGVSIVLCTGRPLPGVQEQLNELDLFQDNDYVITYNGALVQQTKSGKIIARHGLTHEDFLEIEVMAVISIRLMTKQSTHLIEISALIRYTKQA
mgnify:CR=1 FL=1